MANESQMPSAAVYQAAANRYDAMEYRLCGRSGLRLPRLSLGLWHNFGSVDDFGKATAMVCRAFDRGITHFDLANNYGPEPGTAEENFGRILSAQLAGHRDELIISTKAGHRMWPGPYGDGCSRKSLMSSLDQSLRRMRLDYVDIFYSHRYDADTPLEETACALADIVRSGKALYIGISKYPAPEARRMYALLESLGTPCLIHQDRYSMLVRKPEQGVLEAVQEQGVGFIAFSPLAQGLLTDKYLNGVPEGSRAAGPSVFLKRDDITPGLQARLRRLNAVASDYGCSLSQLALRWVMDAPAVTSVIVGASSVAQIDSNLEVLSVPPLSAGQRAELASVLEA